MESSASRIRIVPTWPRDSVCNWFSNCHKFILPLLATVTLLRPAGLIFLFFLNPFPYSEWSSFLMSTAEGQCDTKPQTFHYSCNLIHNITSNCWSSTIWHLSTKPEQVVQLVIISKAAWNLNNFSMKWKIFGFNKTHQNWLLHFPPIIFHVFSDSHSISLCKLSV